MKRAHKGSFFFLFVSKIRFFFSVINKKKTEVLHEVHGK